MALSPVAYSELLHTLAGGVKADFFSLGGVVGEFEERMAVELGKEAAVWMPTKARAVPSMSSLRSTALVSQTSRLAAL